MFDERLRQCVSCRQLRPRHSLIRLACNRVGEFSLDNAPPLQGRSAYACRNTACLAEALKGRKFQRTLKRAIPDVIVEALNLQLSQLEGKMTP